MVHGAAGIGKTRLLQWVEAEARKQGFRSLWGYCLKEEVSPFFPFEQVLRRLGSKDGAKDSSPGEGARSEGAPIDETASVVLFEEEKPRRLFEHLVELSRKHPCLLLSRERAHTLRQRFPQMGESARLLWLSRTEGEDVISPSQLDTLGELGENHLRHEPGSVLALAGLEYLVSQNSFLPVLRLVQFLRDVAEGTEGHLLLSVHPSAFDARESSLLEAEGEVVRPEAASDAGKPARSDPSRPTSAGEEPSSATLLRYVQTLETVSREGPILLILDDFQWADESSALAFQFLARNLRHAPVVLAMAVREKEAREGREERGTLEASAAVQSVVDQLGREGLLHHVVLHGLGAEESQSLVESSLGATLAAGESRRSSRTLFEVTAGNPYYLLQVLGQLREEGLARVTDGRAQLTLPASADGASPGGTTPRNGSALPTVRRMVQRQLEGLPSEQRALLETAALIGRSFDLPPLVDVLGRTREDLRARAERLATHLPILAEGEIPGGYTFQNLLLWEAAREGSTAEVRRSRCRALAEWYSSRRPEEVETIARLYHESGDRKHGLPWIRKAADRALQSQASDAVERYVRWAEDLLRGSDEDWESRVTEGVRLAEGIREQGALRDARRLLQGMLEAGPPPELQWGVERAMVEVEADLDARQARAHLEALEARVAALSGGPPAEARALLGVTRAHVLTLAGQWDEALRSAREALALLGAAGGGDPGERSQALYSAGWCLKQLGRLDEAREAFAEGRVAATVAERPGLVSSHTNGEGAVALLRGDLPAARRAFEDAADQCRRTGNIGRVASILLNLAEVNLNLGDLDAARRSTEEAQALSEKFDVPRVAANAAFRMGVLYQKERRWEEAVKAYRSALERYERLGLSDLSYSTRINLALLRGIMGDPRTALAEMDEMVRKSVGVDLRNLPLYHQTRAELKGFVGDTEGARRELERGLEAARASQNLLSEASVLEALGTWEQAHGDPSRAKVHRELAENLYHQCGLPRGPERSPGGSSPPSL